MVFMFDSLEGLDLELVNLGAQEELQWIEQMIAFWSVTVKTTVSMYLNWMVHML